MQNIRTDLALEACEIWQENADRQTELSGVIAEEKEINGHKVHRVEIINEDGERALGKPQGTYITIELFGVARREDAVFPRAIKTVSDALSKILPKNCETVLIAGLGNRAITPDAVGDVSIENVMVTRHLVDNLPEYFSSFKKVSAIAPGVLGTTGVESYEIIAGVANRISPDCIIVIDALASRSIDRLCNTIQITDTGIIPGSGVGNSRRAINRETLNIPVIAIGVPTVVDVSSVIYDIITDSGMKLPEHILESYSESLMVTPKEIDTQISDVGKIIGYAINMSLQPDITIEDMDTFLS